MNEDKRNPADPMRGSTDELSQVLMDATPICANCWNREYQNIACNTEAAKLFDLSSKQEYLDRFFELSPLRQPDGTLSSKKVQGYIETAFREGRCQFQWLHQKLNGEPIPAEITLVRTTYNGEDIVAGYTRDLREWNRTMAIMRAADERTQIMLDATPLCANFWDKDYNNIDCNQEAVNLFDLSCKQEYLDRFYELSPEYQPDGRLSSESSLEKIQTAFREGYCRFQWMHQKLNGEPVPSEITLVRVKHRSGDVVVGYTRDLRELRATMDKMREADERTQVMLDAMPLCANFWDKDFNNIDCNQEAVNLFGLSSKQEYLDRFHELSPECQPNGRLSSEMAIEKVQAAFRDGHCRFEWMHQKLNGEPVPSEITLVRGKHRNGDVVIGYTRDLREIKASMEKMREADERTQLMLDATPLCCNLWDKDYNNIDCNQEAVNLFGLSSKQEYLDRFFELSPEHQPDGQLSSVKARHNIKRAFSTGQCRFEWMHQKLNGEPVPAEITLVRVRYKDGYIVAGYTRDMRELKATLDKMEKTQQELRRARDRAEESAQAKSNFLATMSHEIRTPMNAIIGMTEIAKDSGDEERVRYCLDKIDDAATHLLGIINDILDMSKIESGKFTFSPTDFVLEDMLQHVINVISYKVDEKRQHLIVRQSSAVPPAVVTDQQRLVQVITNLLSNAVKFTSEGGIIHLRVDSTPGPGKSCTLQFCVEDTGIGISAEQQAKLFQSFAQADGSISRRFGGTGLGLAISKNIVEMMGGRIWVESEEGQGSRFFFTVRAKVSETAAGEAPPLPADTRLLAVGSLPQRLESLCEKAALLGLACATVLGTGAADEMLRKEKPFDVLFLDWALPEDEIVRFVEGLSHRQHAPDVVALVSSEDQVRLENEAARHGIRHFLAKPVLRATLDRSLWKVLGLETEQAAQVKERADQGIFAGKQLLLAEDVEINREILLALLKDTGVHIDCAEDGQRAVDMFAENPDKYDMIFMDVHMPGLDGYQATTAIRAMPVPRAKTVPIIAMTANVFREDIERCLRVGMDDHVGKPLDIDVVIDRMKQYINRR